MHVTKRLILLLMLSLYFLKLLFLQVLSLTFFDWAVSLRSKLESTQPRNVFASFPRLSLFSHLPPQGILDSFYQRAFRAIIPINYRAQLLSICTDHWGIISPGVFLPLASSGPAPPFREAKRNRMWNFSVLLVSDSIVCLSGTADAHWVIIFSVEAGGWQNRCASL